MANRQLQGWSADPFGQHEQRYFSAGRATKLVRDGKVESYEDPPADDYDAPDDEAEAEEAEEAAPGPGVVPARRPAGGAPPRAGVSGQYGRGPGTAPGVPRRPVGRLLVAAALVIAITVVAAILLVKQESPTNSTTSTPSQTPTSSPAAFVSRSAR